MPKLLSIVASLTIITSVCGLALGALYEGTRDRIALQILENKQLPAARKVLREADNDLLADHKTLKLDAKTKVALFVGRRRGEEQPYGVAFESTSEKGFGGELGLMVGFDLRSGDLLGVFVTTHHETPGVGARAAQDGPFIEQFRGLKRTTTFRVKQDGGQIDALTGATFTSRAVCDAIQSALRFYREHAEDIGRLVGAGVNIEQTGGEQ